ncbi:MAG: radical SAM protein, partial [Streptococcaceae bacterium]|nr:radical SAM protein [Streptococcaceae bacterium]
AIILERFSSVEQEILDAVINGNTVSNIKSIIYKCDNSIHHTGYPEKDEKSTPSYIQYRHITSKLSFNIPPHSLVNVHLFPDLKCYWNKCNFCGINQKYHFNNPNEIIGLFEMQMGSLQKLIDSDISYIWFIDEAIHPNLLKKLASYLIQKGAKIRWQVRSRIEPELLYDNLPELLAESGLRELRLGLESGSKSVLKKMNKFDDAFSYELVDELCKRYSSLGISLHFPMIIGFPGETNIELMETYELLGRLREQYPLTTFNINIFGLDVSSKIFYDWAKFNIQSISFPCLPTYYLGNILTWYDSSVNYDELYIKRDNFMREQLYPWMPSRTLTPPHILYRLSETIRNTLIWKDNLIENYSNFNYYITGDLTIFYDKQKSLNYIYSWNSHHYMLGNEIVIILLDLFRKPNTINVVIEELKKHSSFKYTKKDFEELVNRLVFYRYLFKVTDERR